MTRDAIFFTFGAVVAGIISVIGIPIAAPERGLIVCHADGTTFTGHIDTQGISQADLSNAVQIMCKVKERMGV